VSTTIRTNVRQLFWIPAKGEHFISVNVALVPDLGKLWEFTKTIGFKPELASMQYPNRVEIHLLLLHEQLDPSTVVGFEWNPLIDRLIEVGVPDEAVRHTYGGQMSNAA
jgi:hypothetical protein